MNDYTVCPQNVFHQCGKWKTWPRNGTETVGFCSWICVSRLYGWQYAMWLPKNPVHVFLKLNVPRRRKEKGLSRSRQVKCLLELHSAPGTVFWKERLWLTESAQRSMSSLTPHPGVRIDSDVRVTSCKRLEECHVEPDWMYSMWYKGRVLEKLGEPNSPRWQLELLQLRLWDHKCPISWDSDHLAEI